MTLLARGRTSLAHLPVSLEYGKEELLSLTEMIDIKLHFPRCTLPAFPPVFAQFSLQLKMRCAVACPLGLSATCRPWESQMLAGWLEAGGEQSRSP